MKCPRGCYAYLQAFSITVATILGTGILALPIELYSSGLLPFIFIFIICLCMQISVVYLMVELLQHSHVALIAEKLGETTLNVFGDLRSENNYQKNNNIIINKNNKSNNDTDVDKPDLHRIGRLFLTNVWLARTFDFAVILHFMAVLISYALAGPQAYADLLQIEDYHVLIVPYTLIYTLFILLSGDYIKPIISILTILKMLALICVLFAVSVVADLINIESKNDFSAALEPFLMGTFALGGVVNLMPVMYEKLPFIFDNGNVFTTQQKIFAKQENKKLIQGFRISITLGVLACFLLNILWCLFVLQIVPQTNDYNIAVNNNNNNENQKYNNYTLENCYHNGEISTIPVVHIIETYFPAYRWTIFFIDGFVIVSITVSFLTLGKGLKHVLDGISFKFITEKDANESENNNISADISSINNNEKQPFFNRLLSVKIILYIIGFGIILIMALLNPQGFLTMLSVFGSFALNIECGVFVSLMAQEIKSNDKFVNNFIPLKISNNIAMNLIKFAKYTFSFAILYDWFTCGIRFGIDPILWYIIASIVFCIFLFTLYFRKKAFKKFLGDKDENYKVLNDENDNISNNNNNKIHSDVNDNVILDSSVENRSRNTYSAPTITNSSDSELEDVPI